MPTRLTLLAAAVLSTAATARAADFTADVRPVLAKHCASCHGPDKQRGGLRLDSASAVRQGGNSGPAIVPGRSAESRLILALSGSKDVAKMPPKGPGPSDAEAAALRRWIDSGAAVPAGEKAEGNGSAKSAHWAFQPIKRPSVPEIRSPGSAVRNPIDAFILARLQKEGLKPSPEADKVTLIRRVTLDLTGLLPTVAEVDDFLKDTSPDAYEKVVDRLLASPHYGERWGRHWLDQARYADSNGYSIDGPRTIWPYRDWVINALNADMPFDRFTTEQLAGDLLPKATVSQKVATGFHR